MMDVQLLETGAFETNEPHTKQLWTSYKFKPSYIDTSIATIITLSIPIFFKFLYETLDGAGVPLLIYYLVLCLFIPQWRRGAYNDTFYFNYFDYKLAVLEQRHKRLFWIIFAILVSFECIKVFFTAQIIIVDENWNKIDFYLTVFIWCPINSFCEQISWMYILDAFWNRSYYTGVNTGSSDMEMNINSGDSSKNAATSMDKKIIYAWGHVGLGLTMCLIFVGTIHVFFWTQFLMEFDKSESTLYSIFFAFKIISIVGYVILWKLGHSMIPLFALHIMSDVSSVVAAKYGIFSHL